MPIYSLGKISQWLKHKLKICASVGNGFLNNPGIHAGD